MRTIPQVARIKSPPQRLPALRQGYGGQAENAEVQPLAPKRLTQTPYKIRVHSCPFVVEVLFILAA